MGVQGNRVQLTDHYTAPRSAQRHTRPTMLLHGITGREGYTSALKGSALYMTRAGALWGMPRTAPAKPV